MHEGDPLIEVPEHIKELKLINVSVRDNVVIVNYNNPYSKVNSYSSQCNQEVVKVFNFIADNQKIVRGTVVTSSKIDNFFAGVDIKELDSWLPEYAYYISQKGQEVLRTFHHFSKPSVAVIMGSCLGAGFELANSCHYRIAIDIPSTVIGLPEVLLGLIPGATGTVFTPRRHEFSMAVQMMLSGKTYTAKKAKQLGLVDEVIKAPNISGNSKVLNVLGDIGFDAIERLEKKIVNAKTPSWYDWMFMKGLEYEFFRNYVFSSLRKEVLKKTRGLYPAPMELLNVIETSFRDGLEYGLAAESDAFQRVFESKEHKSLLKVFNNQMHCKKNHYAINEKETNGNRSRSTSEVNYNSITTPVDHIKVNLITDKISVDEDEVKDIMQSKNIKISLEDENDSVKIFCSSFISPKDVSAKVGMHFFPSIERSPLVEVITTSDDNTDKLTSEAIQIALNLNKIVITSKDGYYTTRLLISLLNETIEMLLNPELNLSIKSLIDYFKNSGFSVDIFRQLDELGLETMLKILQYPCFNEFSNSEIVEKLLAQMIENGLIGINSSKGFYNYVEVSSSRGIKFKREAGISSESEEIVRKIRTSSSVETTYNANDARELIKDRLTLSVVNEAMSCYQKGIIRNHIEGDVGAVFGVAFPPLLVGPFHYVDQSSAKEVIAKIETINNRMPFLKKLNPCLYLKEISDRPFYS